MTQLFGLMSHQAHFSSHLMVRSSFRDRTSVRPGEMPNEQVSETKKEVGRNEEDLGATAWEDPVRTISSPNQVGKEDCDQDPSHK